MHKPKSYMRPLPLRGKTKFAKIFAVVANTRRSTKRSINAIFGKFGQFWEKLKTLLQRCIEMDFLGSFRKILLNFSVL